MNTENWKIRSLLAGVACAALGSTFPAQADYSSTTISQGPVGYWRLNETIQPQNVTTAGNIGSLGASANGAYVNYASGGLPGPFAGSTAVGLDGASQYVSTPGSAGLNGSAFTFEIWASPAQVPKFAYLASAIDFAANRSGWYFAQDDGTTFNAGSAWVVRFFNLNGSTTSGQLSAPVTNAPGSWVHLVLTHDGTVGSLYVNGALITNRTAAYVPTTTQPFTVGARSTLNFFWPGKAAEVAMYSTALSAARVAAHYNAGKTAPATYQATVQADSPVLYHRYTEAGAPPAANLGTLGAAATGAYIYDATAGASGPSSPTYAGFEAANKAASFSGTGPGVVRIPALNLNTNTVTISGWFKPNGSQSVAAGLMVSGAGASASGLTIDQVYGGLGLGYVWGGNNYGVSFSTDLGLPQLQDNDWNYAALVIEPAKATIYVCDANKYGDFTSAANTFNVNHLNQSFSATTLVAAESGSTVRNFRGAVDEVTIFNRALSAGELYTQYASAVGGVPVRIFADLQGPTDTVPLGDPINLIVDAGGTPALSFQWRRDGTNYATTSSGVLAVPTTTVGTFSFDVTISNGIGSPAQSQTVYATVVTPSIPSITSTEGFQNRTIYPKATLRLAVTATGGGLKYQWFKNSAPIAAATGSSFTIASVTNSDAGNYSVSVTNALGMATNSPVAISIPTVVSNTYEAAILASSPQAWWRLAEPAGSVYLVDGMGRHDGYYTNLSNSVPPVALGVPGALVGNTNTGASFSGNGGLGVIPYSGQLNGALFTYEAWVRTTINNNTDLVPLSSSTTSSGNWWRTYPAGFWSPQGNTGYAPIYDEGNTEAVVIPNVWTHLVMCYDGSRFIDGTAYPWTYFVNGVTDGFVWTGATPATDGPFIIGGRGRTGSPMADFFWNGQVDEVAVYQRVLPTGEITAHYQARGVEIIPPTFTVGLLSQTVTAGKTVSFTTGVLGTSPALQWSKNGTPITSATNATLTLSSVSASDQGTYTLTASNSAGTNSVSATLTVIPQTSYASVTSGSVLHLRFDGNTSDSSGRGNDGVPVGSPAYVAGIVGPQALQYTTTCITNNGTNISVSAASYVRFGAVPTGPPTDLRFGAATSFTVSLWVKLPASALPGDLPFIGTATNAANNAGWVLCPSYNGGGWQWCLNDGSNNFDVNGADNSINDGAWHNFVLSVDRTGALAKSYLDGVMVDSRSIAGLGSIDNSNYWPMVIGQDPTGTYPQITGASATDFAAFFPPNAATLDDVGIWTRALTAAEIAKIESAGRLGGRSFDTVAPSPVTLTVTKSASDLILAWPTGTLLQSDTLGAGAVWTQVPGVAAPSATVSPTGGSKYYRVWVQ